jgi:mono/diheme cytochrome c family protein
MRTVWTRPSAIVVVSLILAIWAAHGVRSDAHAADTRSVAKIPTGVAAVTAHTSPRQSAAATVSRASPALFQQYCVTCHNERMKGRFGNLSLETLDPADVSDHAETFEKVVRKLRKGLMPPEGRPRPDAATLDRFVTALETALDRVAAHQPHPGRVIARRLNRTEYVNAVYDLLGLEVNGSELLPSDMAGFGFDNNAEVLSITPALMARQITAATKISRVALATPDNRPATQQYKVEIGTRQEARMGEAMPFASFGGLAVRHTFPLDGDYAFQLRLTRDQDGLINGIMAEHQIELRVDRALVKRFTIGGHYTEPDAGQLIAVPEDDVAGMKVHQYYISADDALTIRVPVPAGTRTVTAAFVESEPIPGPRGREGRGGGVALIGGGGAASLDTLSISGPFNATRTANTPTRQHIFVCTPATARDEEPCARRILTTLARRAYRGAATDTDLEPLLALYRKGRAAQDFDTGLERALEALLSSPKFVLRIEQDGADPGAPTHRLSDLELASRLSFFLWRSIPDDELLRVAERRQLHDPQVLARQVRRLLADDRSRRFLNDFSEQWLEVRNLSTQQPAQAFQFDPTLRDAMAKETALFFESQVREDRPIPDLLRANYTFLNERLAEHYGLPGIFGSHFRRVTLTDENRFGLLGHASVLTITSNNDRTSVVKRGYWILDVLLGSPPPPPPPNVPPLKDRDPRSTPTALRERMEQHRNSPACASCHARMDPLGFALEHYDAVGRFRQTDGGAPIDSEIRFNGAPVTDLKAFRQALLGQGDEVLRTVAEKLLTYALGRGLTDHDAPLVRELLRTVHQHDDRWSSLLLGVVTSDQFQMRAAPEPVSVAPAQP